MSNLKSGLKAWSSKLMLAVVLCGCFFVNPAKATVKSYQVKPDGVIFMLDMGMMKVQVCKDDIIEVKYTIFDKFSDKPSLVVNAKWQNTPFAFKQTPGEYVITTKKLIITINKASNAVSYSDLHGHVITSESEQ